MKHYTPDVPKLRIYFSADKAFSENTYLIKKTIREAVRATLFSEKFEKSVTNHEKNAIIQIERLASRRKE